MTSEQIEKKLAKIKSKLYKKCLTCEHYGPSFGVCLNKKHQSFTNQRGICDDYQVLNDAELLEYTEKERKEGGWYEF